MPDKSAYEASTLDWARIRAYARRVARETRKPTESGISYTRTEYQTVTKRVEVRHGLFNMFTKVQHRPERVAVIQRVDVVGPHWVLDRRNQHIERNTRHRNTTHQETTHEQSWVVLLPDGSLKKVVLWEEENLRTENNRSTYFGTHSHSIADLGDGDVRAMDFEKRHSEYGTHGKGVKTWGDREPGRRLLTHAKGVGLTQALKRLL
ncbi:hypothetical protein ACGFNF_05350 [Micromonospora sp. NPDC048868]|uniref:hypothetical protein n=1 Tax=Micromonospora sp. NPDC048868 TaxID=3364258 RepID=UPI003711B43B